MPELLRRIERAGVQRVVLLTSRCVVGGSRDNAITRMWLDSELALLDSGLAWTILRPSGYQSNALRWLPQLRLGDVVRAPWPDVSIAVWLCDAAAHVHVHHRRRQGGRQAQPLHHRRPEFLVPGVPRAASPEDDEGDADGRHLRPLPDDPEDRARAEADAPLRRLRRKRGRRLPPRAVRGLQGAPPADAARAGRSARDGEARDRGVRARAARGPGLRSRRHHRESDPRRLHRGHGRRHLLVGQGPDPALHGRRQHRRARHHEEQASAPTGWGTSWR